MGIWTTLDLNGFGGHIVNIVNDFTISLLQTKEKKQKQFFLFMFCTRIPTEYVWVFFSLSVQNSNEMELCMKTNGQSQCNTMCREKLDWTMTYLCFVVSNLVSFELTYVFHDIIKGNNKKRKAINIYVFVYLSTTRRDSTGPGTNFLCAAI